MEDLQGKTTANTISSTYANQAEQYGATVTGVDDLNQTIELLLAGRIDATLNAEVVFADYQKAHPEANIKVAAYSDEVERVAIPVRKGEDSASLLAAINDALAQMDADGTLTQLSENTSPPTSPSPSDGDPLQKRPGRHIACRVCLFFCGYASSRKRTAARTACFPSGRLTAMRQRLPSRF